MRDRHWGSGSGTLIVERTRAHKAAERGYHSEALYFPTGETLLQRLYANLPGGEDPAARCRVKGAHSDDKGKR